MCFKSGEDACRPLGKVNQAQRSCQPEAKHSQTEGKGNIAQPAEALKDAVTSELTPGLIGGVVFSIHRVAPTPLGYVEVYASTAGPFAPIGAPGTAIVLAIVWYFWLCCTFEP